MLPLLYSSFIIQISQSLPKIQNGIEVEHANEHVLIFQSSEHQVDEYHTLISLLEHPKRAIWLAPDSGFSYVFFKNSLAILHSFEGRHVLEWSIANQVYPQRLVLIGVPLIPNCNPKFLSEVKMLPSYISDRSLQWCENGDSIDLNDYPSPIKMVSSPLDYASPPEMNFEMLPPYAHHRIGPQYFQSTIPEHNEIIYHPSTLFYISRFVDGKKIKILRKSKK